MKTFAILAGSIGPLYLAACASAPDHFYALDAASISVQTGSPPSVHVHLQVTLPALIDRAEMVLYTPPNKIAILEHERWAAPIRDLVSQALARDLEARRSDILVGGQAFDQSTSPPVAIKVDIVRMSAESGGATTIEARWRIVDPVAGVDLIDAATFEEPSRGTGFASIAQGYSASLVALANRLSVSVRHR